MVDVEKILIDKKPDFLKIASNIGRFYSLDSDDIQDIYQETCIKIWNTRDRINEDSTIENYFSRICGRVALDIIRYRKYVKENNLRLVNDFNQGSFELARFVGTDHCPSNGFIYSGVRFVQEKELDAIFRELTTKERIVFTHLKEERTAVELSKVLKLTTSGTKNRIYDLREFFKRRLSCPVNELIFEI